MEVRNGLGRAPEQYRLAERKLGLIWKAEAAQVISILCWLALILMIALQAWGTWVLSFGLLGALVFAEGIALVVCYVLYLVGLFGLRPLEPGYRTAFGCEIARLVVVIFSVLPQWSGLEKELGLVESVLSLAAVCFFLQATGRLLAEIGREKLRRRGRLVLCLYAVNCVIGVLVDFLCPEGEQLAEQWGLLILCIALLILSLVPVFLYLDHLKRSAKAFQEAGEERPEGEEDMGLS